MVIDHAAEPDIEPINAGGDASGDPRRTKRTDRIARFRPARLGLRTRILLMFTFGALLLAVFLAALAYGFTRSSLLTAREQAATEQAARNAQIVDAELQGEGATPADALDRLQTLGFTNTALIVDGVWAAGSAPYGPAVIPDSLEQEVIVDQRPARMIVDIENEPVLIVGIPLPDENAAYFEFVSLSDAQSTLRSVLLSLVFGGIITTMIGGLLGWFAANRAVRPLADAARAATAIAGGRLDTRLETTDDHDLQLLAGSFNEMAAALQTRVERDARFASDVSHELRSPLMTLAASAEVMEARRDEMPERAQAALDLLLADLTRFQGLVEDLLEISRFDAGAIRLHLEDLLVAEFVRQAVAISSLPGSPVDVSPRAEGLVIRGDRRRLARVVANLIDNARVHGGAEPEITVIEADGDGEPLGHVWIAVEDHGAGVPAEERSIVFDRFARGAVAGRRSSSDGAGLGLALVDEHVRMHGGRVWVEDRLDGEPGARFVVELPAEELS
jgi:two-component system, OmpR family, sensor histidine kinase MtrB